MPLFTTGQFTLHSGEQSAFKIDVDCLTDADLETLAALIAAKVSFRQVHGIPTGGTRLAAALASYAQPDDAALPILLADDVLTSGASMEEARARLRPEWSLGVVLFARRKPPVWVRAVFQFWE